MGGGKLKPEDLFNSLKIIKEQSTKEPKSVAQTFFERFNSKMTEKSSVVQLRDGQIEVEGYL
jgi:hypothetical protein